MDTSGGFIRSILKRFLVQRSFFFVELLQLLQLPEHSIVSFVRSSSCMAMAWLGNSGRGGFSAPSEPSSSIQVHFSLLVVLNGQARRATPTFPQSLSQFAKIKFRQNQLFPAFRYIRGARVRSVLRKTCRPDHFSLVTPLCYCYRETLAGVIFKIPSIQKSSTDSVTS